MFFEGDRMSSACVLARVRKLGMFRRSASDSSRSSFAESDQRDDVKRRSASLMMVSTSMLYPASAASEKKRERFSGFC